MPYNFKSFSKIEEEIEAMELEKAAKERTQEELPDGANIETEELQNVDDDGDGESSDD